MTAHPWLTSPDELRDQRTPATPRQTYRLALILAGFDPEQAATLAAWSAGIHIEDTGGRWAMRTLDHLLFLRDCADRDRLGGPDDGVRR